MKVLQRAHLVDLGAGQPRDQQVAGEPRVGVRQRARVAQDQVAVQPQVPRRHRGRPVRPPTHADAVYGGLSSGRAMGALCRLQLRNIGGISTAGISGRASHGASTGWCVAAHLQWLDWMPPMVITQSWPCALTSAIRNSSFRTWTQHQAGTFDPCSRHWFTTASFGCRAIYGSRSCCRTHEVRQ